jgi:hypothetical protein
VSQFSQRREMYAPSSLQSHGQVGVLCFLELHRRIHGRNFGRVPSHLSDDAFAAAGHCLDAHELLPAGSVESKSFQGADEVEWIWLPTTIKRSKR